VLEGNSLKNKVKDEIQDVVLDSKIMNLPFIRTKSRSILRSCLMTKVRTEGRLI
jgi:hypothetical protein